MRANCVFLHSTALYAHASLTLNMAAPSVVVSESILSEDKLVDTWPDYRSESSASNSRSRVAQTPCLSRLKIHPLAHIAYSMPLIVDDNDAAVGLQETIKFLHLQMPTIHHYAPYCSVSSHMISTPLFTV